MEQLLVEGRDDEGLQVVELPVDRRAHEEGPVRLLRPPRERLEVHRQVVVGPQWDQVVVGLASELDEYTVLWTQEWSVPWEPLAPQDPVHVQRPRLDPHGPRPPRATPSGRTFDRTPAPTRLPEDPRRP